MNKRILGIAALLALSFALPTGVLAQGDATKGEKEFKKCMSCHSIEEGGKNKTGPNLWNVMNRGVAKVEGYKYSKGLTKWSEENPEWTPELMNEWLTNSKKLVKGTKMMYKNKKEKSRADIIAYLQSMGEEVEVEVNE
jgi:cytochrome c